MAFLHCHDCDWSQDDFWSDSGYSLIRSILEDLKGFEKRINRGERTISLDGFLANRVLGNEGECGGVKEVGLLDFIAYELERTGRILRGMKWPTYEEWEKEPNKVCCWRRTSPVPLH